MTLKLYTWDTFLENKPFSFSIVALNKEDAIQMILKRVELLNEWAPTKEAELLIKTELEKNFKIKDCITTDTVWKALNDNLNNEKHKKIPNTQFFEGIYTPHLGSINNYKYSLLRKNKEDTDFEEVDVSFEEFLRLEEPTVRLFNPYGFATFVISMDS